MTDEVVALDVPQPVAFLTPDVFTMLERISNMMATATVAVPEHCRNKPGNCFAIVSRAHVWRMDPFALASKTFVVGSQIGYEAQAVGAAINSSGLLKDRLNFEWFGPWEKVIGRFETRTSRTKTNEHGEAQTYRAPAWRPADEEGLGVNVWATLKGEDEPRVLTVLLTQARVRNSTLWADDPKQQIGYLAEKKWGRLHTPEVLLGVRTRDELEEIEHGERNMGAADEVPRASALPVSRTESVKAKLRKPPTLAVVLKAIDDARDAAALRAAGDLAARLADEGEKAQARKHWQKRRDEAQTAAAPRNEPVEMTFAEVSESMNAAARNGDVDALGAAATMIGQVKSEQQQQELRTMFDDLMTKLDEAANGATS
ncbi:RecT family protein [Paraburkholderia sp. BL8N3]|nr:RecT family recombinase [Paraburkholderia sp. BL8N3]TCK38001.1 RecT family protein [Paraburkholderia sp. BL8N3]